jgi:alpha-tubulin suppressor-like RCC1 family protein
MRLPACLVAFVCLLMACQIRVDAFEPRFGEDSGTQSVSAPNLVALSWYATFAQVNGRLYAWGSSGSALGDAGSAIPLDYGPSSFTQLRIGDESWCGLVTDGGVVCQGGNSAGQLGVGDFTARAAAVSVELPAPAIQLSLTGKHVCALLSTQALYCWGRNTEGELGLDDAFGAPDKPTPQNQPGVWLDVDVGDGHTCAVTASNEVRCWGRNSQAQLGLGSTMTTRAMRRPQPPAANGLRATAVRAALLGTCIIDVDAGLWCWGSTTWDGGTDMETTLVPTRFGTETGWTEFSLSAFNGCGKRNGQWSCAGRNVEGQFGLGDTVARRPFAVVPPAASSGSLVVGGFHTCFIGADGGVRCAGRNDRGLLGNGSSRNSSQFVAPALPF